MQVLHSYRTYAAALGLLLVLVPAGTGAEVKAEPASSPWSTEQAAREAEAAKERQALEAKTYLEAAAAGDAAALLRVGLLYETGAGLPQDYVKAREHYELAVKAGLPAAHFHLALCLLEGWGGPVDKEGFAREIRLAAEGGYVPAQRVLATLCFVGFGTPKDQAAGLHWLQRASAADDLESQLALGQELENKTRKAILAEDMERARRWYMLSAEQDYHTAMRALNRSLLQAPPGQRNWALATQWLDLATEGGDREAPYTRALLELLHPDSPKRDEARARTWLKLAADRQNYRAALILRREAEGVPLHTAMDTLLQTSAEEVYVQLHSRQPAPSTRVMEANPELIYMPRPNYPLSLRILQVTGSATVSFVVETDGTPSQVAVMKATHPLFGEAALEAARSMRFKPGIRNGNVARVRTGMPMIFEIDDEELSGVDGIISDAKDFIQAHTQIGPEYTANLVMGVPDGPPPPIVMTDGNAPGKDVYCSFLVVVKPDGGVSRTHTLSSSPGVDFRATAEKVLKTRFKPRIVNGEPEQTNCVIILGAVEKLYPMLGIKAKR